MRLFALGFCAGVAALLWWIGRSMGTPSMARRIEEEWRVPVADPYVDGLPW